LACSHPASRDDGCEHASKLVAIAPSPGNATKTCSRPLAAAPEGVSRALTIGARNVQGEVAGCRVTAHEAGCPVWTGLAICARRSKSTANGSFANDGRALGDGGVVVATEAGSVAAGRVGEGNKVGASRW
ncbi:hypothetical protein HUS71_12795, partial [Pandoraea nosoerga]|nr:hypothetical protein [Pandoraea nosoerga]